MKKQLIESDYRGDFTREVYLVELGCGRKVEVEFTHSTFDGYNNHGPDNPDDGSYVYNMAKIINPDSDKEFEVELPEVVQKLIDMFEENGKIEIKQESAPIGSAWKWS